MDSIFDDISSRSKDREKAVVFHQIFCMDAPTRKRIASDLNLRPTGVSKAVQELIDDGLVMEGLPANRGHRGRPEPTLRVVPSRVGAISIHNVGLELVGYLFDLSERIVASRRLMLSERTSNRDFTGTLRTMIEDLVQAKSVDCRVAGVGISLLGILSPAKSVWHQCSHLPDIRDLSFDRIAQQLSLPLRIRHSLDAEMEYILASERKTRDRIVGLVHWGYGIGATLSIQGAIVSPRKGRFGEIGHIAVNHNDHKLCKCGEHGCLETESAMWAVVPALYDSGAVSAVDLQNDEQTFASFLSTQEALKLPPVRHALDYFSTALLAFHRTVNPDLLYLMGPFTDTDEIFLELEQRLQRSVKSFSQLDVALQRRIGGFQGCINANTYPFFREVLRRLLRAS